MLLSVCRHIFRYRTSNGPVPESAVPQSTGLFESSVKRDGFYVLRGDGMPYGKKRDHDLINDIICGYMIMFFSDQGSTINVMKT